MTTFTWVAGTSGDWNTTTDWTPTGVPGTTDTVLIPDGSASFDAKIGAGETEIINGLSIGSLSGTAPTLEVAGTLEIGGTSPTITFADGEILVDSNGLFEGAAPNSTYYSSPGVTFVNNGTVRADGGSGTALQVLTELTNNGTLLADNGILSIGGLGLSNLHGSSLIGGSYIVEGPASGLLNEIEIGGNFNAVIGSDSATIVLDGAATDIMGFSGGNFQPIEQQLTTIAGGGGTLEVLDGRGYVSSNALTDNGVIILQGGSFATGTLTIGGAGEFQGFGIIDSPLVAQGQLIASGGALDVAGGGSVTGAVTTNAGASLILAGGSPGFVTNNGVIYDTSGLLSVNSNLSGSGTFVVQSGGTLNLASGLTTQEIVFSGANATVDLVNPSNYKGTLVGFGPGDSLIIKATADTATVVNNDTLAVISAGSTIDTFVLGGTYAGATFSVTQSGSNAIIQNTGGAPARDDFSYTISVDDTDGLSNAVQTEIVNDLSAAANDWAQYVTGHAPLRIQLNITSSSSNGSELANGGFTSSQPTSEVIGGQTIYIPSSIYALTTGNYVSGTTSDITINLPLMTGEIGSAGGLYVNPSPFTGNDSIPSNEYDLLTVFRHELAHGLGFDGFTDPITGALGADVTLFDHYIQDTIVAGTITAANFTGPDAEAAYGAFLGTNVSTPVPLTLLNNGENFFHVSNSSSDPLGEDLMSGVGLTPGTSRDISSVDLAMLQDVGLPVTAGVVCYLRGTRIATPDGDVAIEDLRVGDLVMTASGEHHPIKWIGRRRIDCHRHPRPEEVHPVRISAGAFAPDLPGRDLLVSPQHAIFTEEVLIPARCLINGRTVAQVQMAFVEYLHIELEHHDLLIAEGLAAESYLDVGDRDRFENGGLPLVLHPNFAGLTWQGCGCAELKVAGPEVQAARWKLARRADSQGQMREAV